MTIMCKVQCTNLRLEDVLYQSFFLPQERELLFKAYYVYVRLLLEHCSAVWSPHLKFLVVKTETESV